MRLKLIGILLMLSGIAYSLEVEMIDLKTKEKIGTVEINQNKYGVEFKPNLKNLPPGLHGFHIHEKGSLQETFDSKGNVVLGGGAGGHYDPYKTNKHGLPWDDSSHKGDLPALYVDSNGFANNPVLSSKLEINELNNKTLMIHQHGDNHSDNPSPLGGGGSRIAAGIISF